MFVEWDKLGRMYSKLEVVDWLFDGMMAISIVRGPGGIGRKG